MIKMTEVTTMETKKIILKLRTERGMSQDDLADKVMVTRQAVSRLSLIHIWSCGSICTEKSNVISNS